MTDREEKNSIAHDSYVDVSSVLDRGPFSGVQILAIMLATLAVILDGFDGQMIGFALPSIILEFGITRGDIAPAVAAGLFGLAVGGISAGLFADKVGRRIALIISVVLFGVATFCIGFTNNLTSITILRFIAGLGIGGAMPSAATLTAEFTPTRWRTLVVTTISVCYPVGGMLAGLFASQILPGYGWRGLFWIGGLLPVVAAILLVAILPETPRFLARHRARWSELHVLLARMSRRASEGTVFIDSSEQGTEPRTGVRPLFERGRAADTTAIWIAFFMVMLASYSAFSWLPAMLAAEGLPIALTPSGLTAYNFGGIFGAILCALTVSRLGSRLPLTVFCIGAAASAFLLKGVNILGHTDWLIVGLGLHGFFVIGVQATMYALCVHVYPTDTRATGLASGLSFGRLGAIFSAYAGAAVITRGGGSAYLDMLWISMALTGVALLLVRRHIPKVAAKLPIDTKLPEEGNLYQRP